jgi:hypothetical protein
MYAIDKAKLKEYMRKPVTSSYRTGNTTLPLPVTFDGVAPVTPCYLEEDRRKEDLPEEDKNKKSVSGHSSKPASAGLSIAGGFGGSYLCATPSPDHKNQKQPANGPLHNVKPSMLPPQGPVAKTNIQPLSAVPVSGNGSTVPLRSANDVWDMLDAIPTDTQTEMAEALDYRTAHANRFNV